ncbi:class I SAM-dependent methyltransferase [Nocardia implantans]|uniref:S-adenosyl-L-methionine-dependent methyltransferase n=1 Tax=Nocardia implantans TaxID=3108168 RepID=A0ABU6ASS4_9NOCA|nr:MULTISPECIES: class I SAM-dependent methyltransferase [unclassified Nocardia]MBF6190875.1 class I SAM-dependent methyltransferase [Nocardia beijingensis]MEA3528865.1 class I SAM-dependent methyltransferase [Nocardia sp. CDC192]MEB3510530.1 class I SAM-dependent methyltransferase [Nocardia sp. CDC186]
MRTDGDVWDIVSSVGLTALGVATFRALETAAPDPLIRDDYAPLFVAASGHPHFTGLLADPSPLDDIPLVPGFMGLRTKFFDDFFLSAAAAGVRQAVIVAAGLDARAQRLNWPAGTTVFEIDQPKVLEFKEKVLTEHGARAKAERRTVPVDLREDWPAALRGAGFDPAAPTAWSAEGLLPYLPGAAQDRLFEHIDALSAPGSRLAVESFVAGVDVKRFANVESKYFGRYNPFGDVDPAELFYDDERADPARWLAEHGWSVRAESPSELAASYGRSVPDLPEELDDLWRQPRLLTAAR